MIRPNQPSACSNLPFSRCGFAARFGKAFPREYTNGAIEGHGGVVSNPWHTNALAKHSRCDPPESGRRQQESRRHYIGSSRNLHTSCRHPGTTLSRWCLPRAGSRLGFGGKFDNLPSLKLNETSALPEAHIPGWVAADALACQTDSAHEHSRKLRFLGTGRVARCSGRQMASRSGHVLCLRGDQCRMTFFEEEVTLNTLVLADSWKVHRISSN